MVTGAVRCRTRVPQTKHQCFCYSFLYWSLSFFIVLFFYYYSITEPTPSSSVKVTLPICPGIPSLLLGLLRFPSPVSFVNIFNNSKVIPLLDPDTVSSVTRLVLLFYDKKVFDSIVSGRSGTVPVLDWGGDVCKHSRLTYVPSRRFRLVSGLGSQTSVTLLTRDWKVSPLLLLFTSP